MRGLLHIVCFGLLLLCQQVGFGQTVFNEVFNYPDRIFYDTIAGDSLYNGDGFSGGVLEWNGHLVGYGLTASNSDVTLDTAFIVPLFVEYDQTGNLIRYVAPSVNSNTSKILNHCQPIGHNRLLCFGSLGGYSGWVTLWDNDYNLIREDVFDYAPRSHFNSFVWDSSNAKAYFVGYVDSDTTPPFITDALYGIYDTTNGIIDTTILKRPNYDWLYAVDDFNGLFYYGLGTTWSMGAGRSDMYLVIFDDNGNLISEYTFGYPGQDAANRNHAIFTNDDWDIFLVGSYEEMDGNVKGWLVKTNHNGDMLLDLKYDRSQQWEQFIQVEQLDNNDLVMLGNNYDTTWLPSDLVPVASLHRVNEIGETIWERTLQYEVGINSYNQPFAMSVSADGGFVVSGGVEKNSHSTTSGIQNMHDAWLVKTDSCGYTVGDEPVLDITLDSVRGNFVYFSINSHDYCTANWAMGDGVTLHTHTNTLHPDSTLQYSYMAEGNYTITVTLEAGDSLATATFPISVDSILNVSINRPTEEGSLRLFPNPLNRSGLEKLYVEQTAKTGFSQYQILNNLGQVVHSGQLNPRLVQQELNIPPLPSGAYRVLFYGKETGVESKTFMLY